MAEVWYFAAALAASCLGFCCLAMSMARHWQDITGEQAGPHPASALRAVGYSTLAASLVLLWLLDGPGFGSVLWVLMLTVTAAAVAFVLTWRPTWLRALARMIKHLHGVRRSG
jgi:hypothetical protein